MKMVYGSGGVTFSHFLRVYPWLIKGKLNIVKKMWRIFTFAVFISGCLTQASENAFVNTVVNRGALKGYLQPIIYKKLLPFRDSPVVQQAKVFVSEFLSESLVESIVETKQDKDAVSSSGRSPKQVPISSANNSTYNAVLTNPLVIASLTPDERQELTPQQLQLLQQQLGLGGAVSGGAINGVGSGVVNGVGGGVVNGVGGGAGIGGGSGAVSTGVFGNSSRPSQEHVVNQVDRIIDSVNNYNITGIVDQALLIRSPPGVRQLVNGIINLVFCNPVNRLWNRCAGGGGLLGRRRSIDYK